MILNFDKPLSRQDTLRIAKLLNLEVEQLNHQMLDVKSHIDSNRLKMLQSYGYNFSYENDDSFEIKEQQNSRATISLEGKNVTQPSQPKRKGVSGKIEKRNL
jgi:phage antirepressor YoqD-like protein